MVASIYPTTALVSSVSVFENAQIVTLDLRGGGGYRSGRYNGAVLPPYGDGV